MGQETGFLVAGWSGVVLCSRHPAYVGRSVLIQSDMVVGARSDFPDAAAAVTSRTSVTNGAVAIAACPRDVEANRSIANRQNDCAPKTLASSGTSGRVEPSTTVDGARTAATCRVHRSSSALLPRAVHSNMLQSTHQHDKSRYPHPAQVCAVEHAHKDFELPTNHSALVSCDASDLPRIKQDNERLAAENDALRQQVASLKASGAHLQLHPSQLGLQEQLTGVQHGLAAALGKLGADVRAALPRQRSSHYANLPSEPAYGRCPFTRREMPREMTADEFNFIVTDQEPTLPRRQIVEKANPDFDAACARPDPPASMSNEWVAFAYCAELNAFRNASQATRRRCLHTDEEYQAIIARARREHNARRFERRDLRVAQVIQRAISDRRAALRAVAPCSRDARCDGAPCDGAPCLSAETARVVDAAAARAADGGAEAARVVGAEAARVADEGAAALQSPLCGDLVPLSADVKNYEMHDVLCLLHASGSCVDVATVRLLRQRFGVCFDMQAYLVRQAAYADPVGWNVDLTTAGNAQAFAVDAVIAEERATRERWRGRRKPTGRPDIGSKEARQSKRAKV